MNRNWVAAAILMTVAGNVAANEGLDNTFVEVGQVTFEYDDMADLDVDGNRVNANVDLVSGIYLTFDWWDTSVEYGDAFDDWSYSVKAETNWYLPGAGFRFSVSDNMQFAGELAYLKYTSDSEFVSRESGVPEAIERDSVDEDGSSLKLLWRWLPVAQLEVGVEAQRMHVLDEDVDLYAASLRLHMTDSFSIGYQFQQWDDAEMDRQNLNLRFAF